MYSKIIKLVICIITAHFFVACSDVSLTPMLDPPKEVQSKGEFTLDPPEDIDRSTKFLFIVDKSGSNGSTDRGAEKRFNNILRFYEENKFEESYQWGLQVYVNSGAEPYIQSPYFTKNDNIITDAIERLKSRDSGNTPYGAALSLARSSISTDIKDNETDDSIYMVFFISDGDPTDISNPSQLVGLVEGLVALKPGKIFMSTAYYGPNKANSIARLQEMADAGGGKFVNFNNTDVLDFNELIVLPTKEPWMIKNSMLMVFNTNATTCLDGTMGVDSDSDGLCDKDEIKYGLDPTKRFSIKTIDVKGKKVDVSGYGDYFQWRRLEFGESLPSCNDRSDEDNDLLTACEEAYIYNARPTTVFSDGSPRYNGNPRNPDTDLDGFLDGIEIFMFKDKASANTYLNVLSSFDGEADSAGTQLRQHRNPLVWDPEAFKYNMVIKPIGYDNGSLVYSYEQTKLELFDTLEVKEKDNLPGYAHAAGVNKVLVYYIQTPQNDPDGPGILNYSLQSLVADQRINDSKGTAAGINLACKLDEKGKKVCPFKQYVVPVQ